MSSIELAEKAAKHLLLERGWTKVQMSNDANFNRLGNVRRDFTHLGRLFVAWTIVDGKPLIDTLFKVDRFGVNGCGLNMTIATVSATRESELMRVGHTPTKAGHLDLYFWIPYYAEVRTTPNDHGNPGAGLTCTYPLLIKLQNPPGLSQVEGRLYFASKSDFAALWPEFDF